MRLERRDDGHWLPGTDHDQPPPLPPLILATAVVLITGSFPHRTDHSLTIQLLSREVVISTYSMGVRFFSNFGIYVCLLLYTKIMDVLSGSSECSTIKAPLARKCIRRDQLLPLLQRFYYNRYSIMNQVQRSMMMSSGKRSRQGPRQSTKVPHLARMGEPGVGGAL